MEETVSPALYAKLEAAVERGSVLLDRVDPEWYRKIDPATLEMEKCSRCVIGQIAVLERLDQEDDWKLLGEYQRETQRSRLAQEFYLVELNDLADYAEKLGMWNEDSHQSDFSYAFGFDAVPYWNGTLTSDAAYNALATLWVDKVKERVNR